MTFAAWQTKRLHAQQKRKALQMLALSGVVRPSDVALRYSIPLIKISGPETTRQARSSLREEIVPSPSESSPQAPRQHAHPFKWLHENLSSSS